MNIKVKKLQNNAVVPTQGSKFSAGYDLYSAEQITIAPGKTGTVHTGLAVEIPNGTWLGIYARSGLATKQGLRPANCVGVVDSDYRGEVMVALHNDSDTIWVIEAGTRIAQAILHRVNSMEFEVVDKLSDTDRGEGGFGSTGVS